VKKCTRPTCRSHRRRNCPTGRSITSYMSSEALVQTSRPAPRHRPLPSQLSNVIASEAMRPAKYRPWLRDWSRLWGVPSLSDFTHISVNNRLRRSLGRCRPITGRIHLHPKLAEESESVQEEVLCHEAAHVAVHLLHGPKVRPHGLEWARLMRAAGFEPRTRMDPKLLSAAVQEAARPRLLFRHRCPVCGAARVARRPVRRWRCRACLAAGLDGQLDISSQPAVEARSP